MLALVAGLLVIAKISAGVWCEVEYCDERAQAERLYDQLVVSDHYVLVRTAVVGRQNRSIWWYRASSDPGTIDDIDDVLASYPKDLIFVPWDDHVPKYGSLLPAGRLLPELLAVLPEGVLAEADPSGFEGNSSCGVGLQVGTQDELKRAPDVQSLIPEGEHLLQIEVSCVD